MAVSRVRSFAGRLKQTAERLKQTAERRFRSQSLSSLEMGELGLLICREENQLWLVDILSGDGDIVVLSDNTAVHRAAADRDAVSEVVYLESMQSLLDVSEPVITARDRLNQWLLSLQKDNDVHKDSLFWRPLPEGGQTQRLLDSTILIDSIQSVLSEYEPDFVILPQSLGTRFEDRIIRHTVQPTDSNLLTVNPSVAEMFRLVGGDPSAYFYNRHPRRPIPRYVLWVARSVQFLGEMTYSRLKYILPGIGNTLPSFRNDTKTVVVHHRGSADKHRRDTTSVLPEFVDRPGIAPLVVTWREETGRTMIKECGLSTVPLDGIMPISRTISALRDSARLWRRASSRRHVLEDDPNFTYNGVNLIPILWPEMRKFFRLRIPDRIGLWYASRRYFKNNPPAAMRFAGAGAHVPEGIVSRRVVERVSNPFTFTYRLNPFHVPYPYFKEFFPVNDRYFAAGALERKRLETLGVPESRISEVGTSGFDEILSFRKDYSKVDSRKELSIESRELNVFFAPQGGTRGYYTEREKRTVSERLVRFANNHPEFNLIVKPHPKDMGSPVLNSIKQKYDIKNFHLLETSVSPLHCINAADVVITKSSGTGFEAFLMDTPVISIVLDDDRWFAQYGNAAEQFRKTESLCELLDDLLNDPEKREQWFNQVDDQIETFVTRNLLVTNDPNKRIADSIESAVRDDATEEGNHKN